MGWSNSNSWGDGQEGRPAAGGGTPTLTYIGSATPSYASGVATANTVNIGTAAADRLVVVVIGDGGASASAVAVTVNGTPLTTNALATGSFEPMTVIASGVIAAGSSATIITTYTGYSGGGFGVFEIYTITGLSSTTPVGANQHWDGSANPISTTLATSSGGVIIAASGQAANNSAASFPSSTETFAVDDNPTPIGFYSFGIAHAVGTAANASSTVNASWASSSSHTCVAAVSWR
jgi:hypothetical protein